MERNEKMMKLKLIELKPLIQVHIDVSIFDFQPVRDAVLILIWKIKIIGGDALDGNIRTRNSYTRLRHLIQGSHTYECNISPCKI